jgi:hypothetical protein
LFGNSLFSGKEGVIIEITTPSINVKITKQLKLNGEIAICQPGAKGTLNWSNLVKI